MCQRAAYGPKNPNGRDTLNPIEIPVGRCIVGTVAVSGDVICVGVTSSDPRCIDDDVARPRAS